jgi:2-polyprenyl-6-hydroxyphenyl methylase/3-demethylubiquinone-9 3-methyltransferase
MINNEFYKLLGERWHTAQGDAVALLRRENEAKSPWVREKIRRFHGDRAAVLDVGCGGGFLTLALLREGHQVTGLDVCESVMASGRARDTEKRARWIVGDALALPLPDASFDVVCMMDVLEHVERPRDAVREALRVLKPQGSFLFHTFNRTWLSWLVAAKGLEWFIRDSPAHVHDWAMFVRPAELQGWLSAGGFAVEELRGIHPRIRSVLRLVLSRRVPADFHFVLGGGLQVGYLGCARRARR